LSPDSVKTGYFALIPITNVLNLINKISLILLVHSVLTWQQVIVWSVEQKERYKVRPQLLSKMVSPQQKVLVLNAAQRCSE